jgi:membrane protein YdbS with pleckstrin-like domain
VWQMALQKREKLPKPFMVTKVSRKSFFLAYLMALIIAVAAAYMVFFSDYGVNALVFYIALIFVFLLIVFPELHRFNHIYSLTDEYLLHTWGIGTRKTKRIHYGPISDVDVIQRPFQMMLGFGDIHVHVFSKDSIVEINNINKPKRFAKALIDAKAEAGEE